MKDSLENFNFGSIKSYKILDIILKMIRFTLKSTRLSKRDKKRFITVLGILDKLNVKLSIEPVKQNINDNKENSKKKWNGFKNFKENR